MKVPRASDLSDGNVAVTKAGDLRRPYQGWTLGLAQTHSLLQSTVTSLSLSPTRLYHFLNSALARPATAKHLPSTHPAALDVDGDHGHIFLVAAQAAA